MSVESDKDFLNSGFPIYAAVAVGIFVLYRVYVSNMRGEPLQPARLAQGTFPAAFFTLVGAFACHEMYLDMTGYPGGLSAWAPAVVTVLAATFVAYRGQAAASCGELGFGGIFVVVGLAIGAVYWLLTEKEEPPQNLTKAQMKKAAKEAAKAAKEAVKRAAEGLAPPLPMLSLEKGDDFLSEKMHVALAVMVVLVLVLGLVNGPGVWPRNLQKGPFPACFMIVTAAMAWNSFVRQARSAEGGSLDDFIPAFIVTLAATLIANKGSAMQATPNP